MKNEITVQIEIIDSMINICDLLSTALDYVAANYGDSCTKSIREKCNSMRKELEQYLNS